MSFRNILSVYCPPAMHWVGNGFPVKSLFSYNQFDPKQISPFLLLDYAGPAEFTASNEKRGVGQHPHKGFETVTIVYDGELAHKDSTGSGGTISKGDVQWMTAGSGIIHEEFHSEAFTQQGGTLEMIQLWVNLPAKFKTEAAKYQSILSQDITTVPLANKAGTVAVIAGSYEKAKGPASTYTDINVWNVSLNPQSHTVFDVPDGHNALIVIRRGSVSINQTEKASAAELVIFGQQGKSIAIASDEGAELVVLTGEPIDEPVVGHGPFVMNSMAEIQHAAYEFHTGRFGKIAN